VPHRATLPQYEPTTPPAQASDQAVPKSIQQASVEERPQLTAAARSLSRFSVRLVRPGAPLRQPVSSTAGASAAALNGVCVLPALLMVLARSARLVALATLAGVALNTNLRRNAIYALKAVQFLVHGSWSYTRGGFEKHQRAYFRAEDVAVDLHDKHVLITGANSGIGYCAAEALGLRGATVHLLCRNSERGEAAKMRLVQKLSERTGAATGVSVSTSAAERVHLHVVDVSEAHSIRRFVQDYLERGFPAPNVLVHNAGAMTSPWKATSEGVEVNFATNVMGPVLLTDLLLPSMLQSDSGDHRVIFVTSAGMLTERLETKDLEWRDRARFDATRQYAKNKRQQVAIVEQYARTVSPDKVLFVACHPGWAETPLVQEAMPGFYARLRGSLRTADQGADTIVWLSCVPRSRIEDGMLYFDRNIVPKHLPLSDTSYHVRDAEELLRKVRQRIDEISAKAESSAARVAGAET
jgi:dehydrogenase/reductase SDR family protein 12